MRINDSFPWGWVFERGGRCRSIIRRVYFLFGDISLRAIISITVIIVIVIVVVVIMVIALIVIIVVIEEEVGGVVFSKFIITLF